MSTIFDGTYNARDLGGLPLRDGGRTREDVLYRSDALDTLTDGGVRALAATSTGILIDLRSSAERGDPAGDGRIAERLGAERAVRHVQLPLLEGALTGAPSLEPLDLDADAQRPPRIPTLAELYIHMLSMSRDVFVEIARTVARPADPGRSAVLIHCTAGKDRTGVATALLLDAAGVDRDAVIADYARSQENLAGPWSVRMIDRARSWGLPITPETEALLTATPPTAMQEVLRWLDERGGSREYLRAGGLGASDLQELRERLVG